MDKQIKLIIPEMQSYRVVDIVKNPEKILEGFFNSKYQGNMSDGLNSAFTIDPSCLYNKSDVIIDAQKLIPFGATVNLEEKVVNFGGMAETSDVEDIVKRNVFNLLSDSYKKAIKLAEERGATHVELALFADKGRYGYAEYSGQSGGNPRMLIESKFNVSAQLYLPKE